MTISAHQKWDYLQLSSDADLDLNQLGAEGWEVVSKAATQDAAYLLKRPALTFQEQVTLDQRKRYFAIWGIDIEEIDRNAAE
jgi:hypothetical protein